MQSVCPRQISCFLIWKFYFFFASHCAFAHLMQVCILSLSLLLLLISTNQRVYLSTSVAFTAGWWRLTTFSNKRVHIPRGPESLAFKLSAILTASWLNCSEQAGLVDGRIKAFWVKIVLIGRESCKRLLLKIYCNSERGWHV